ncbi:MAG: 6-phosphofructokinase [Oscillospiraceae bacterium]|nr:6-phosphofructokinase [Oscillospiraceae bacterium]
MAIKTIGILTSGGDAPGMNAAIRAVVRTAINEGMNVIGVRRGYAGLIASDIIPMQMRSVSDIINRGGTMLYTARCPEFVTDEGQTVAAENCRKLGIDGMVVIGGDGSFRGARALCLKGIPTVAVPGTIDRDVSSSDYTIGFDTAINTVVEMVDRLRDTSQSHDRCSVVEVMGRNAGDIALHAGIACGALTILVPEVEYDFERDVIQKMRKTLKTGKHHFIIVVAEGVGNTEEITKRIEAETGISARLTVLGHVQRGGIPTARERINASRMGYHAVKLLSQGISNRVVGVRDGHVVDYDILEALDMKKNFDAELYEIANKISL